VPIILDPPPVAPLVEPVAPSEPLPTLAERLYDRWEPYWGTDAENGYVLWYLAQALTANLEDVYSLARDSDTHDAWHAVFDPYAAPVWLLPWLAQVVQVTLLPSDTEDQERHRIASAAGFYRGTTRAIQEEVARTLISGDPDRVRVVKAGAWAISVITSTADTPDPAATARAALCQKPAGVFPFTVIVSDEPIIDEGTRTIDAGTVTIDAPPTMADVT
jgi:hypothetical protein